METKVITIENISVDELADRVAEKLLQKIDILKENKDVILTKKEAEQFLNINPSTLHNWVKKGKVICYGIGRRRYFKKQELIDSLVKLKN